MKIVKRRKPECWSRSHNPDGVKMKQLRDKIFRCPQCNLVVEFQNDEPPPDWYQEVPFNDPPLQPPVCFDHPLLPRCMQCDSQMLLFGAGVNWDNKNCSLYFICKSNDNHRVDAFPEPLDEDRIQELSDSIKETIGDYLIEDILMKKGPVGPVALLLKKEQSVNPNGLTPDELSKLIEMLTYLESSGLIHSFRTEEGQIKWTVEDYFINQLEAAADLGRRQQ